MPKKRGESNFPPTEERGFFETETSWGKNLHEKKLTRKTTAATTCPPLHGCKENFPGQTEQKRSQRLKATGSKKA